MPRAAGVNGIALAATAAGVVLVYSGVTGKGVLATVQATIQGQNPAGSPNAHPIAGSTAPPEPGALPATPEPGATPPGSTSTSSTPPQAHSGGTGGGGQPTPGQGTQPGALVFAAQDAQKYVGAGYQFGGHPADGIGHWDCSSFMNKVVGIDTGLPIPGYDAGVYDGKTHGPIALQWFAWTHLTTVGHDGDTAQVGDFCCWQTHIGICIGGGQMVSARNEREGTGISHINSGGPAGEILSIRRWKV